jgi:uncharacterized protein YdeI (BOF family)
MKYVIIGLMAAMLASPALAQSAPSFNGPVSSSSPSQGGFGQSEPTEPPTEPPEEPFDSL